MTGDCGEGEGYKAKREVGIADGKEVKTNRQGMRLPRDRWPGTSSRNKALPVAMPSEMYAAHRRASGKNEQSQAQSA